MPKAKDKEIWITAPQVAAILGTHRNVVYRFDDSLSPIVFIRPNGRKLRRYSLSVVEAYKAARDRKREARARYQASRDNYERTK